MIYSVESQHRDVKTPLANQSPAFVIYPALTWNDHEAVLTPSVLMCSMLSKKKNHWLSS